MLRDGTRKSREELEGRVHFLGSQCHKELPLQRTGSCGGNSGAGTLLNALWAAGRAVLKGL